MSRFQTYRVIVTKPELFAIDVAARSDAHAIERAEALWYGKQRSKFERVVGNEQEKFEVDEEASLHLEDIANEDRCRWAEHALRCFSAVTGSGIGAEGLHDLLCDLGHYADRLKIDFPAELQRAAAVWSDEKSGEKRP